MGAALDLFARRGDGTEFPVDIQVGPIEIDGARLAITIVRDLTERKALHQQLAESHQQAAIFEARQAGYRALHTALESTTDSVVVLDREWCFSYLNENATACLGHGNDLRGQAIWDAFPGLTDSNIGAALRNAVEADAPTSAHGCFVQSGTHFEAHAYPSPEGLTIFLRDVTQERNSAALLAQSEALLRLFIERAPASIAMFDTEMCYLAVSQRFALDYRIRNDRSDTLVGRSHYEVFPEIPEHWRAAHRRVLNGETLSADEDPFPRTDRTTDWVRWEMTPWRHADGTIGGAMLFSQIVTEQRAAEQALRKLTEDLAVRLYENEDLMAILRDEVGAREAAQRRAAHAERLQALGQLAGGIAHDFNNVLQLIQGATTLIDQHTDDDGIVRLARLAMKAARRGGAITRRLLAFGRRGDLRAETLDVAAMLNGLREIFVHTLGVNIEVDIGLEEGLPPVFADKAQLETVLVNLATNARDAMPEGGRLSLSAVTEIVPPGSAPNLPSLAPGRYVRLLVADTGTGMDADTLARAQEPFFTTKGSGAGTGLGLPMARSFSEQSGGALHIESSPGHGTTITLWLPEDGADRSIATVVTPDAPEAAISVTRTPSQPARVLLVDDEDELREVLAQNLEERGYNVLEAVSSREALALLADGETVDILVTDLSMPNMDGIALIQHAHQRRPGLPAVLLTGYVGDGVAVATDEAITGAYSLARKPIGTNDLIDLIEALLATKAPRAHAPAWAQDHHANGTMAR
jgi:PAS domain S-box-containing protein